MNEALKARQENMDSINRLNTQLTAEAQAASRQLADPLREDVERLNADWERIRYLAAHLRPRSDVELERKVIIQQRIGERSIGVRRGGGSGKVIDGVESLCFNFLGKVFTIYERENRV